jgi:hypothetical protein
MKRTCSCEEDTRRKLLLLYGMSMKTSARRVLGNSCAVSCGAEQTLMARLYTVCCALPSKSKTDRTLQETHLQLQLWRHTFRRSINCDRLPSEMYTLHAAQWITHPHLTRGIYASIARC